MTTEFLEQKVSRSDAAQLLGLSRGRISQLEHDKILKADDAGQFTLGKLVTDWLQHLDQRTDQSRLDDDARMRKLKIAALEEKEAQRRGVLVAWPIALERMQAYVGKKLSSVRSIPARFSRDAKERKKLQEMIDEALAS